MIFFSVVPYESLFNTQERKRDARNVSGGVVMLSEDATGKHVDSIFSTDLKMYLDPKFQPGATIK